MCGLHQAILMRTEFLKLGFEQLTFIVCDRFLIQDQYLRDVVGVDLYSDSVSNEANVQIEQYNRSLPSPLDLSRPDFVRA